MDRITEYLPCILGVLPFVLAVVALAVQGRLHGFARETVAAVYRVAIRSADALQDEGITWLRSEAGIAYRCQLAEEAYDLLPDTIRGIPVGLVKTLISRERWIELVEEAFQEIVGLAERIELPEELLIG